MKPSALSLFLGFSLVQTRELTDSAARISTVHGGMERWLGSTAHCRRSSCGGIFALNLRLVADMGCRYGFHFIRLVSGQNKLTWSLPILRLWRIGFTASISAINSFLGGSWSYLKLGAPGARGLRIDSGIRFDTQTLTWVVSWSHYQHLMTCGVLRSHGQWLIASCCTGKLSLLVPMGLFQGLDDRYPGADRPPVNPV